MRYQKYIAALFVGLMIMSAGCAGILGGGSTAQTTQTTPAPTTNPNGDEVDGTNNSTTQSPVEDVELPNGITKSNVKEAALMDAYRSHLQSADSYTVNRSKVISTDGFTANETIVTKVEGASSLVATAGDAGNLVTWSDGQQTYSKATQGNTTRYMAESSAPRAVETMQLFQLENYVEGADFQYQNTVVKNGEIVHVLTSTSVKDNNKLSRAVYGPVQDYNATLYVDNNGVIDQLNYKVDFATNGGETTYDGTITVDRVGATTVEKPSWISTAKEQALNATLSKDGNAVAVTIQNGDVPAGASVQFSSPSGTYAVKLSQSVSAGDVIYVGVNSNGEGVVSVNSKPSDLKDENVGYVVITNDNMLLFRGGF